jgi:hypothetical protein
MLMRYHWGLSVGHIYSHPSSGLQDTQRANLVHKSNVEEINEDDVGVDDIMVEMEHHGEENDEHADDDHIGDATSEPDEHGSDISNYNGGDDGDGDGDGGNGDNDDDLLAFDEMYGDEDDWEVYD